MTKKYYKISVSSANNRNKIAQIQLLCLKLGNKDPK